MATKMLKDCKKGEFIKRKADSKKTFIKDDYDRGEKKFYLTDTDDVWGGGILLKGSTIVHTGFDY